MRLFYVHFLSGYLLKKSHILYRVEIMPASGCYVDNLIVVYTLHFTSIVFWLIHEKYRVGDPDPVCFWSDPDPSQGIDSSIFFSRKSSFSFSFEGADFGSGFPKGRHGSVLFTGRIRIHNSRFIHWQSVLLLQNILIRVSWTINTFQTENMQRTFEKLPY